MNLAHVSVLKREAIKFLNVVKPGKLYIDATAGGGGHTEEILKLGGKVLAIDRDPEAIKHIKNQFKNCKLILAQGNFSNISQIAQSHGFTSVDGILFDLGLSSYQLEDAKRGFSFKKNGPLDMRMDPSLALSAKDIINNFEKRRLNEIFKTFADERLSRPIADAICSTRQIKPIDSTNELASIVQEVYRKKRVKTKIDPATKVFMALRIIVNSELINLKEALPQADKLLKGGGRLVVISFHSLEDAIVKRFFKDAPNLKVLTKSPVGPTEEEIKRNPRARSARLRIAEKIIN